MSSGEARARVDPARLKELLAGEYGLEGRLEDLPGDRDRNYLLSTSEERFVVKVSSPLDPLPILEFEAGMIRLLSEQTEGLVPGITPAAVGELLVPWEDGETFVRVVRHREGVILAKVAPRPPELLADVGRRVAQLVSALGAVPDHPPARFDFDWALGNAGLVMDRALPLLAGEKRALLDRVRDAFDRMAPRFLSLGSQMIHGDLNDHNILVSQGRAGLAVSGIIDLGDAHSAPRVFDLGIAVAYSIFDTDDPLTAAVALVEGFHREQPLLEAELDVVMALARARLGQSVAMARLRREKGEVDEYHLVSESSAWKMIAYLDKVEDVVATGMLRAACGLEPVPAGAPLRSWLKRKAPRPVVGIGDWSEVGVLDLSVGSWLVDSRETDDAGAFSHKLERRLREKGWKYAIGRYLEPRAFYATEAFRGREGDPRERRTVHLGLDIFAPAGTSIHAPLDSTVACIRDNSARLDYGPTVVLEHEGPHGPFWTLYGHLDAAALHLEPGAVLRTGDEFAALGAPPENGDWPPHLHMQVIADRLGCEGDFPGVALPREEAVWASLSPDPNLLLGMPFETMFRHETDLHERRRRVLGGNLSLSYSRPLRMERGRGAYLYDARGREYLDCVNNPAHVGHEHPVVVEAGRRQMAVLNTNTRYLHPLVVEYAERLTAELPEPLSVCWMVNSGSEANELALRMARAATGKRGVVTLEGGYHGNTTTLIELSHYKSPRTVGRDPAGPVRAAPLPDTYRGLYRSDDSARLYAQGVAAAIRELEATSHGASAFLVESVMSCGGQIVLPDGYLDLAFRAARETGALCIADEVQVGFGRVGSHTWGFEAAGAVPDIVTLGKPMGNGHPIGAVVTTPAIAERFAGEMEYFSTFGGNPVSSAIGLAVLDVMEAEDLQHHAWEVGEHLKAGLRELASRHEGIGDVRGLGLFLGIEFVLTAEGREPDRAGARTVVEHVRRRGVLLSTDGPDDNVIKIKPPLVFSRADADRVVEEVDRVLEWRRVPQPGPLPPARFGRVP